MNQPIDFSKFKGRETGYSETQPVSETQSVSESTNLRKFLSRVAQFLVFGLLFLIGAIIFDQLCTEGPLHGTGAGWKCLVMLIFIFLLLCLGAILLAERLREYILKRGE